MTDPNHFFLTEPYREARHKAEIDLDNWRKAEEVRSIKGLTWFCVGLSVVIVAFWIGIAYYASSGN